MANFKIVKHRRSYHVIGYEGVKKPKNGKKPTYREQCISSHSRMLPKALERAEAALLEYKRAKLQLSALTEPSKVVRWLKEIPAGLLIAIACGVVYELTVKFAFH